MTSQAPDVLVVIPCYNEERRLAQEPYLEFAGREPGYRFLFVDDGSRDRTLQQIQYLCERDPHRFEVLRLARNSGKAEAVRQGFLAGMRSGASLLAYWDADLATPLDTLPSFRRLFRERPALEMVFGSRVRLLGHEIQRLALRHYLGRAFATCASLALALPVYDTQCGAKMFRRTEALGAVFQQPFRSQWIFDVELIARFLQWKRRAGQPNAAASLYELPLPVWRDVAGSKVRPVDFFKALGELIHIHFRYAGA